MESLPKRFGPFLLLERLGEGASSTVYLARLAGSTPGLFVIKALHRHLFDDERVVARFKHEAAMAVRIDSPYLARAHALGAIDGQLYIAMEHVAGAPLSAILRMLTSRDRRIPVFDAVDIALDMLRGLEALHDAKDPKTGADLGFVHRDIAPKNVIITDSKRAVIVDLGVGKSNRQSWRTATGAVVGTPGYMSPEQLVGAKVDCRADLYAVGVVLWEMLTLRRYVKTSKSVAEVLENAAAARFVPPSKLRADVSPVLDAAVERALERTPEDRYPDAASFIAALEAVRRNAEATDAWAGMEDVLAKTTIRPDPRVTALSFEDETRRDVYPTVEIYASSDVYDVTPPARPPPATATRWIVALAASSIVFTAIGIAVGVSWARRDVAPAPRDATVATVVAQPGVRASPVEAVRDGGVRDAASEVVTSTPTRTVRRRRRPVEVEPPPEQTPRERFEEAAAALLSRARRVRAAHPERADRIDLLIGDVTRERLSSDYEGAQARLRVLERRLDALEK
ncbi:MAG: serine/threonine-protein kinase [Deltaproteobacteria bacterium]